MSARHGIVMLMRGGEASEKSKVRINLTSVREDSRRVVCNTAQVMGATRNRRKFLVVFDGGWYCTGILLESKMRSFLVPPVNMGIRGRQQNGGKSALS